VAEEDAGGRVVIRPTLDVGTFLQEGAAGLEARLVAGRAGLASRISVSRIQKLSLALTGFLAQIRTGRLQVVGETEIEYCRDLSVDQRRQVFDAACRVPVTAFIVTKGLTPPPELVEQAERHGVPVLACPERSSVVIDRVQRFLDERLAPRVTIHGVLLEVSGLGVLLLGESGIGKSECALDLVQRGHRLIADDVVEVMQLSTHLVGIGPEPLRHHMELRGIGIINIKDLFGVAAICERKDVELVVRLVRWEKGAEIDRLGLDEHYHEILGMKVPYMEMPVAPGRNLAILVEVAARSHMLKLTGYHPARALVERLDGRRGAGRPGTETP
jgi:HPr kinase/phosphorylase